MSADKLVKRRGGVGQSLSQINNSHIYVLGQVELSCVGTLMICLWTTLCESVLDIGIMVVYNK